MRMKAAARNFRCLSSLSILSFDVATTRSLSPYTCRLLDVLKRRWDGTESLCWPHEELCQHPRPHPSFVQKNNIKHPSPPRTTVPSLHSEIDPSILYLPTPRPLISIFCLYQPTFIHPETRFVQDEALQHPNPSLPHLHRLRRHALRPAQAPRRPQRHRQVLHQRRHRRPVHLRQERRQQRAGSW